MPEQHIINFSGGKDSTALLLLAIERETANMTAVFADTGNEHELTYEYIAYISATVCPIVVVRADFSRQIANKREYVLTKWAEKGVTQSVIDCAVAALVPTGSPFLDLCIWKGRFPSTKAAFCSEELKRNPVAMQIQQPHLDAGRDVMSWQGVRRDESLNRRFLIERELKLTHKSTSAELWNYRPILDWTADDAFAMHKKHGIQHNPLYEMGMGRVGCMPCINCRKDELLEISKRFPDAVARIAEWESLVARASKQSMATFFPTVQRDWDGQSEITHEKYGIGAAVEWSRTSHGGKQFDFLRIEQDGVACSSVYGLCE